MTDFLKMDVFFVVATVATAVIALIAIVALVYAIRFLRTLNRIGDTVEEEAEAIREDIRDARNRVRGFRFSELFSLFGKTIRRAAPRAKKK